MAVSVAPLTAPRRLELHCRPGATGGKRQSFALKRLAVLEQKPSQQNVPVVEAKKATPPEHWSGSR